MNKIIVSNNVKLIFENTNLLFPTEFNYIIISRSTFISRLETLIRKHLITKRIALNKC